MNGCPVVLGAESHSNIDIAGMHVAVGTRVHSEKRAILSGDSIRATSPPIPTHQMSWAMAKPEVQEVFEMHAAIWGALRQQHCDVKLACNTDDPYRSHKQWVDYVREDLLDLHFAELSITWWGKSQDRAGWRATIGCLLQRT